MRTTNNCKSFAGGIERLPDIDYCWDTEKVQSIRRQFSVGKQYLFCSTSCLEQEKNIPFLLRTVQIFKALYGNCFKLIILGEGSYRDALTQQIHERDLAEDVLLTGHIEHNDLFSFYKASDLFLFASQNETQNTVLLDAMAAGLPVIAVDASGVCDIIRDFENGLKAVSNETLFAACIRDILNSTDLYNHMRRGAKQTALRYSAATPKRQPSS